MTREDMARACEDVAVGAFTSADDVNAHLLAAAAELRKPDGWQPITTAPKDREIVLIGDTTNNPGNGPFSVKSCVSRWHSDPEVHPWFVGWLYSAPGYQDKFEPTHWAELPIPAPPVAPKVVKS